MSIPYDVFTGAFLAKITERNLLSLGKVDRMEIVDGYMKKSIANSSFKKVCAYDLTSTQDDILREFSIDIDEGEIEEIADIVSEGMLTHWMKPYVYKQELLENAINTRDFNIYSPAELLLRVNNAYTKAQKDYINMIREYSYNHGDLTDLHL